MDPLDSPALDEDALIEALEAEAQYQRYWLPPEPWWDALVADKASLAKAVQRKLQRGARWPRSEVVDVRKPGHGIRPVSLMSPEVRVAYRAIVSAVIPPEARADRSAARYAEFVTEPVRAAFDNVAGFQFIADSKYSHVVIADVAAFYEYIDHAVLRDEFDLAGANISLVDGLLGLLADIEGHGFGIPQRSAPSDWISEYYAARVERWVVRDGFDTWKYSDDFRVGCTSYAEALRAIESLSRGARDVGLVLNDRKTATPSFLTYLMHQSGSEINEASVSIDPSDVEAAVSSDYSPDDEDQAVEEADQTLQKLWEPNDQGEPWTAQLWDLRKLDGDQHRAVRRALNTLTKHADPRGLPQLLSILVFQPAMTHQVMGYASAVAQVDESAVAALFDVAIAKVSLNEWQRAWVAYGIRSCEVEVSQDDERFDWLQRQLVERPGSLSAAEAAVTLAGLGHVGFELLEGLLRSASDDIAPWYLHALGVLNAAGSVPGQQLAALRGSSAVAAAILK